MPSKKMLDVEGWTPAALTAPSDPDMDWAWAVLSCHPLLAKQIPEQDRQATLQQGYARWVGSNFITTAELSRAFWKNLSAW